MDQEEIEVIWTHYVQDLFAYNRVEPELRETGEDQPMVILLSEVKYAIK